MCHTTNFLGIVSGFKNYMFPSDEMEKIARERAKVCASCSNCDPNYPFKLFNGETITDIKGMGCKLCGCLLSAKTRQSFSACPEGKWAEKEQDKNLSTVN